MPFFFILLLTLASSCCRTSTVIEPVICSPSHPKEKQKQLAIHLPSSFSVSPFPPLSSEEKQTDWGKEYQIAHAFAADFDLYRAITTFKRALYLLPPQEEQRHKEILYAIALSYFLGKKYTETIYIIENSDLKYSQDDFPAYADLLLILYGSYEELGSEEDAHRILCLIEQKNSNQAKKLSLLEACKKADFPFLEEEAIQNPDHTYFQEILKGYHQKKKSVRKAEFLNALLPGAGYWYVGQRQTAVTAFLVNALFISAAAHFICHGNQAAGAITLSFEGGWYFGGIYGGGLAAKYYNERLYEKYVAKITARESYFPIMMLKYSF